MTTETHTHDEKMVIMSTANFATRVVSYLIDIAVIWGLSQIVVYPFLNALNLSEGYLFVPYLSTESIVSAVLMVIYFVLMTYYLNQTLGKMVTGIKVKSETGGKLTWSQVIYREIIGRFINNSLFYLPYLAVLFTERRTGIHDYFADTFVVNEKFDTYREEISKEISSSEEKLDNLKISQESSTTNI